MKRLRTAKKCKQKIQQKRIDFHLLLVESVAWISILKILYPNWLRRKNVLKVFSLFKYILRNENRGVMESLTRQCFRAIYPMLYFNWSILSPQMDTLYTTGHLHGFPSTLNISSSTTSFYNPIGSTWSNQEGVVALGVVLGSSISLVGLAFAFITYR